MSTNKNIISIDITPEYTITAIYNKQKNISNFIKIEGNEFIKTIVAFEDKNALIGNEAEIVSKAKELFPEPETPVKTVSSFFGIFKLTLFKLCSFAP